MARLADMPRVFRCVGFFPFARRVWSEIIDDDLFTWASALAYSWLLAIFPFLIFLLTFLPQLPASLQAEAEREVQRMVYDAAPGRDAAKTIWGNIHDNVHNLLHDKQGKLWPRILGLMLAVWAASGGMSVTLAALDKCYDLDKHRPFYKQRLIALGLTLLATALLFLLVSVLPVGTLARNWLIHSGRLSSGSKALLAFDALRLTLSILFPFLMLAFLYHFGPGIKHRFVWVTPGALFTVSVWLALAFVFKFYVAKWGTYDQTYGTVGGVAVLLLVFYIDALVLLIGAEINSEVDFEVLKVRRGTNDFSKPEDLGCEAPTAM